MDKLKMAGGQGKKVRKLTARRIKIISAFLTKTLKFPHHYDPFSSPDWIKMLLKFLCESKHCKITCIDVKAWLTADCFKQLIQQIHQQEKCGGIASSGRKNNSSSSVAEVSAFSEHPWSNVLEALNLTRLQPQVIISAACSSSSVNKETNVGDNSSEDSMSMEASAAQALLMLRNNYARQAYRQHDKTSQVSIIQSEQTC